MDDKIWVLVIEYPSTVSVFGPETHDAVQQFAGTMLSSGATVRMTRIYPIGGDDD